ncbi:MAG: hypothetical protein IM526_02695 [Microcystis sp. M38BS1]|uniref:hypothetical protein n=1 Tax=Microcystis sp. M38BS1 TaxID=2771188 RepID=UPI0031FD54C9|nr:hypothetical protein [Microcystis sp. M38BS1]MCA6582569.1 hypothetical protein [Pseudanabaena sp. M34BS1SP1A06MG]
MTTQIETLKPVTAENGIEFYVNSDGTEAGVSIAGLARLCGVSRGLLSEMFSGVTRTLPEALKPIQEDIFLKSHEGIKGAKIVTAKVATQVIKYYACESKAANATARHSLDKFLEIGFTSWVKKVTGFSDSINHYSLNETLNALLADVRSTNQNVESLTKEVKSWRTVKTVADNHMKGLNVLFEEIELAELEKEDSDYILAPANERTWSVTEWLAQEKGILAGGLERGKMLGLGRAIAETYKTLRQQPIKRGYRIINGNQAKVAVYSKEDFPILSVTFTKFMA